MKVFFWVLVVCAVIWLLRSKKITAKAATPERTADKDAEPMVRCAHCGVHLPASESVVAASGANYCSEEHRLRHAS